MAEREVFPFEDDRELISRWLRGDARHFAGSTDWLSVTNQQLGLAGFATKVAWFDSAGALTVKLAGGAHYGSVVRVIHEICAQLGIKDVRVERSIVDEMVPDPTTGGTRYMREFTYWIDGVPVTLDQAHVLVGPMGMMAWRESVK